MRNAECDVEGPIVRLLLHTKDVIAVGAQKDSDMRSDLSMVLVPVGLMPYKVRINTVPRLVNVNT